MDLTPRAVIAGRYRVDSKVGAGGMGEVWVGELLGGGGQRVAVKTLLPAAAMNHEVVARFKREAYLLGRIQSQHVARVVDFVPDDVYGLVLVMEFVAGDPLSRVLQERTLTVEEGYDLAVGLASALKDLHAANIIHRDLKPGNIIMAPMADGRRRAVVVDFGVSRLMSDKTADEDEELTGITRADMAVGTIEYMAPEQILNSRSVTPGSDIYAAGAMLYRACAGRHVFGAVASDAELAQKKLTTESPPLPVNPGDHLAEGLARVVARMIKRRPKERYLNADEVLADLAALRGPAHADETESPTIDMSKGLPPAAMAALAAMPRAPAASAPQIVAAPAPVAAAPPPASSPTPSAPAPQVMGAAPAQAAPPSGDSRLSIAVPQPAADPPRRGISPLLTFGLVAAALVGGVFLSPRILQLAGQAPAPAVAPPVAAAPPPAPPVTATPTATATAAMIAPAPSASAAPATAADAGAAQAGDAGAAAPAGAIDGGVKRIPGPMPAPKPL